MMKDKSKSYLNYIRKIQKKSIKRIIIIKGEHFLPYYRDKAKHINMSFISNILIAKSTE